jgi:hypothetical protein
VTVEVFVAQPPRIVFYSWQSDLPNATNRSFIEKALEQAAKALRDEAPLIIDRDTKDVPGAPDISRTIYGKIDQAHIFVCDVSIINQDALNQHPDVRPVSNPNVLLELGYALRALGEKRIIIVLNEEYGKLEHLPFDLCPRRCIRYRTSKDSADRTPARRELEQDLTRALGAILSDLDATESKEVAQPSLAEQAQAAVIANEARQTGLVRKYMSGLASHLAAMIPTLPPNEPDRCDELVLQAMAESTRMALEFAHLSEAIALSDAADAARSMYKGFEGILDLYTFPPGFNGPLIEYEHDLAKFLGHELLVTFISFLIRDERWELIADLLEEDLYARARHFGPRRAVPFYHIDQPVSFLYARNDRLRLNRISLHLDLLAERHAQSDLATLVPIEQFVEADYFLYLRAQLQEQESLHGVVPVWAPWSIRCMVQPPRYLQEACRSKYAQRLLCPLGVEDISTLRTGLQKCAAIIARWAGSFSWLFVLADFDYNTIGSR